MPADTKQELLFLKMLRLVCLLVLICCSCSAKAQPLPALIPYNSGDKWGYADTNGNIIIAPQWDNANFFIGDKAMVGIQDRSGKSNNIIYCLINRKGEYIIPPSRHWTGEYTGWRGQLNANTDIFHWGMIDTNNRELIPFDWQPTYYAITPDSLYKVVMQNNLAGIIDRNNKIIIPCRYNGIISCCGLEKLDAFMVTDTGTPRKPNMYGVLDIHNKVLLPMKYHDIAYGESEKGKGYFNVTWATNNDSPGYNYKYQGKCIDLASGKEITPRQINGKQYIKQGDYYLYGEGRGYALLDSNKKQLLPCCNVQSVSKDTVYLELTKNQGEDSIVVTKTYLRTSNLQPYAPATTRVYYAPKRITFGASPGTCGNGVRALHEYQAWYNGLPFVNIDGRPGKEFYKDSFFFRVQGYVTAGPLPRSTHGYISQNYEIGLLKDNINWGNGITGGPILVYGEIPGNYSAGNYSAAVDKNGEYQVKPLKSWYILSYDTATGLASARMSYSNRHTIFNANGDSLIHSVDKQLTGAIKWHGKLYTYIVTYEHANNINSNGNLDLNNMSVTRLVKLADEQGNIIPALSKYHVKGRLFHVNDKEGIVVTDSSDRMGLVTPDGKDVLPGINFKYKFLTIAPNGWILARDTFNHAGVLVDADNREIVPGMKLLYLQEASYIPKFSNRLAPGETLQRLPGMYIATTVPDEKGRSTTYYIDKYRRAYMDGWMKPAAKKTQR